ncbi:hypothetical protein [Micromonospora sp. LOL_024]|uniref:hypothetical protein n=1 Tax=Micromonospora sp. LOL_024 TaxID=3345412 RepID=UPI003A871D4A
MPTHWTPQPRPPGTGTRAAFADVVSAGPAARRLIRTLLAALGTHRWEPWNPNHAHRAHPSPRSLFLTDAVLRIGGHRWAVDVDRRVLTGVACPPSEPLPATVELWGRPDRLPAGYGSLVDALVTIEAGHVAAVLARSATTAGLIARTITVDAVAPLPDAPVVEVALTDGFGSDIAAVDPDDEWCPGARSSGLSPRGLAADPRPLPGNLVDELLRMAGGTPTGSPAAGPAAKWLRHRVAVHAVTGRPDGLYDLHHDRLTLRTPGAATERLQAAFRFGRQEVDVAGMNLVWVVTADVAARVRTAGPSAYRNLLLAAGASAQQIADAAAAKGLFCRPVRSFDEPDTEAAIAAPPGEDVLYMLLLGRPRVLDFCYDLTCPEELP